MTSIKSKKRTEARWPVWSVLACVFACGPQQSHEHGDFDEATNTDELGSGSTTSRRYSPSLGGGVNFAETETFRRCVTTPTVTQRPSMEEASYRETQITTSRDLHSMFEVDASISAKGLWGKAGGAVSSFKDVSVDENGFYWLVKADYILREDHIDTGSEEFSLTPEARQILEEGGLDAFYGACGTHFYSGQQRGAHYALLYEISSKESSVVKKLSAAASYSGFGVEARASFASFAEMAERSQMLRIHSSSAGGDHEIESYALSQDHLREQLGRLRRHLIEESGGIPISYSLMPYDIMPEIARRVSQGDRLFEAQHRSEQHRRHALRTLFKAYEKKSDELKTLDALLMKCSGDEALCRFSVEQDARIRGHMADLYRDIDLLAERGEQCLLEQGNIPEACALGQPEVAAVLVRAELTAEEKRPAQDAEKLGPWTLLPRIDARNHRLSLYAQHQDYPLDAIFFGREFPFLVDQANIYYRTQTLPHVGHILIGQDASVLNPETGSPTQNICLYDFADTCNLRLIELSPRTATSPPLIKLQLVLFNEHGFVMEKRDFAPYGRI